MRRKLASRKGGSTVEFALLLLPLMLMLFGIIEFSVIMYNKAMITNASREGARRGIVYRVDSTTFDYSPLTDPQIITEVTNYLGNHLITLSGASAPAITITRATDVSGDMLTVQVDYPYNFLVLPPFTAIAVPEGAALPGMITLSSATQMRME